MPSEDTIKKFCKQKAEKYDGIMTLWIYQTKYPQIKTQNLAGVCYAITTAWQKSQYTGAKNYEFVNMLRNGIPQRYLDQQKQFEIDKDLNAQALASSIRNYLDNRLEVNPELRQALVETYMLRQRLSLGADCVGYRSFPGGASAATLDNVFATFDTSVPVNFKLAFVSQQGSGHMVGLGFRPDIKASLNPKFPEVYYLIDANFGYFIFGNRTNMLDFFKNTLSRLYEKKYAKCSFKWGRFPLGKSDRSFSEWEKQTTEVMLAGEENKKLDEELKELELELELEELERELDVDLQKL